MIVKTVIDIKNRLKKSRNDLKFTQQLVRKGERDNLI